MWLLTFSRRFTAAALFFFVFVASTRFFYAANSPRVILEQILRSQIQHGTFLSGNQINNSLHIRLQHGAIPEYSQVGEYFTYTLLPSNNPHMAPLLKCSLRPNSHTNHIRLPNIHYNITLTAPEQQPKSNLNLFNPTLIPLPSWSRAAKYILVSRVVTEGLHQESLICLADFCLSHTSTQSNLPPDTTPCSASYSAFLGPHGGMHCTTPPIRLNIPPTPANQCTGAWTAFPDIPGFHDPRLFWSGKGEPLLIVNSASAYGCVGLWMVDLRAVYPDLKKILERQSKGTGAGTEMSYPHLTELTRNPRDSRAAVEKNWMLWFPNADEAYVQYDLVGQDSHGEQKQKQSQPESEHTTHGIRDEPEARTDPVRVNRGKLEDTTGTKGGRGMGGRTFAKLIGAGFTTPNLTSPFEQPCIDPTLSHFRDNFNETGHWHQATPSLRLILCTRNQVRDRACSRHSEELIREGRSVHFAIMHRKFSNAMRLPLRYERYMVMWESRRPFRVLAVGRYPLLMKGEMAKPWSVQENWPDEEDGRYGVLKGWNATQKQKNWKGRARATANRTRLSEAEGKADASAEQRSSAYFTYTPSLAWAWRPKNADVLSDNHSNDDEDVEHLSSLGIGYLGDEVLLGIGLDDIEQVVSRVKVEDLLQCLRLCPGVVV